MTYAHILCNTGVAKLCVFLTMQRASFLNPFDICCNPGGRLNSLAGSEALTSDPNRATWTFSVDYFSLRSTRTKDEAVLCSELALLWVASLRRPGVNSDTV